MKIKIKQQKQYSNNNMQIHTRVIDELIPAEYNPRKISEHDFEQLKTSLTKFNVVEPAIINKHTTRNNIIIGGHQRIKVAQKLNWKTFPCVHVDLPIEQEKELNIRLNKNIGEWDTELLTSNFDIPDLINYGFSEIDFATGIDFDPATEDEQGQLDQLKEKIISCPHCGKEFDASNPDT